MYTALHRRAAYIQIMESVNYKRPHRAIVLCKAKMQLLQTVNDCFDWSEPDDTLLKELAVTLFQSNHYQALYQQCQSKQDAAHTDEQLINELIETYQHISKRRQKPDIQRLNALL